MELVEWIKLLGTVEFWEELFYSFQLSGPITPVLFAMIEAFIPVLPLVAIVTLNVAAHGVVLGFIYSWMGSLLGSMLFFIICRKVFKPLVLKIAGRHPKIMKAREWVSRINKKALFLIICMPFTPSCFVNFAMGVSDYDEESYIKIMGLAKIVMLLLLSFVGQSFVQALRNPLFLFLALGLLVILYLVSRHISKKHDLE